MSKGHQLHQRLYLHFKRQAQGRSTSWSTTSWPKAWLIACCVVLVLIGSSREQALAQPRGLQLADVRGLREAADAQIAPQGNHVAFVVNATTPDGKKSLAQIWLMPIAGPSTAMQRLTNDEASETNPRWSPDGKWLAFYSDRDGKAGLWVAAINTEGKREGEVQLVAHITRSNFYLTHAGESFSWSPDSTRIVFVASNEVLAAAQKRLAAMPASAGPPATNPAGQGSGDALAAIPERLRRPLTKEELDQLPAEIRTMILRAQGQAVAPPATTPTPTAGAASALTEALSQTPDDPRVITRLQYKARTAMSDAAQSHLFIVEVKTGRVTQLTSGAHYEHSPNWSPRGDEIVFVSNHEPEPDKVNNTDLFAVNVTTRAVRQLTKTKGCEWTPVFSPDGKDIAFTGTERAITTIDSVAEDTRAFFLPAAGGAAFAVSRELDRRVGGNVRWSPDGKWLYFTAGDHGKTLLHQATRLGVARVIFDYEAQITSFSVAQNGLFAITITDPTHPAEVYATRKPGHFEPLSKLNEAWLGQFQPVAPREFTFTNEGLSVQGWLYPPVGLPAASGAATKYPVVLSIHGGPHGMHGYGFNLTAQLLAAHGYATLLINPRGSSGYGQKFSDGCVNDWGGGDYRDLMKGIDEALARFPFLDGARMGVMGGSYGGYLTNWIVTQTDRFKAAATSASLANLISFYATSLYQDLIHAEFNGAPWDNYELLWERSPLKHIKKAQTPTLILHGEQDNDVHVTQAEEFYTALRMRGVETVLVRYPREGHSLREPQHRADQLARTLLWFERFLKPMSKQ